MTQIIKKLYAWVATEQDGGEGIIGLRVPSGDWMPLVGADRARIEALRVSAKNIGRETGCPVHMIEFSTRKDHGPA